MTSGFLPGYLDIKGGGFSLKRRSRILAATGSCRPNKDRSPGQDLVEKREPDKRLVRDLLVT